MVDFLIKRLIPHADDPQDQNVRADFGTLGSGVGIAVNVLLAAGKFAVGALAGSVAITADAANNLSDAGNNLMSLAAVRLARKPQDEDHPFGHGRYEYIGALCVGVAILLVAVELFKSAVDAILHPSIPTLSVLPLVVMLVSILAKLWLYRFYNHIGDRIDSAPMKAAAKDSLSDVLATSAVVASMLIGHFFHLPVDGWMGLVVAVLVFRAGVEVCRDMLDSLLGGKTNPELGHQIISILNEYDSILGIHDLMIHDYGPGRCVASVHAEVPADGNVLDLHEMIDRAEQDIGHRLHIPICIHMDPIVTGDPETDRVRDALTAFLREEHPEMQLHDLRRVPGQERTNLVFDVAVPASFRDHQLLSAKLDAKARELDPRHRCVIHYDIDFYHE